VNQERGPVNIAVPTDGSYTSVEMEEQMDKVQGQQQ